MSLAVMISAVATAADLYRVTVDNRHEADALRASGADAVVKIESGYLVLADRERLGDLEESGLSFELIASGVDRTNLAYDIRLDDGNVGRYPVVYSEPGIRLFRVDVASVFAASPDPGLARLPEKSLRIVFKEPVHLKSFRSARATDYDSLIELVSQDSLESYSMALQSFYRRYIGTASNYASREWISNKLTEFGYDSIYNDTFMVGSINCQNVIAVKPGTVLPDHHIIVCAHRDAVSSSPGADDNGSGTVGVLEIARILKDIPTEKTIIFALFDAEEQGLLGSSHYVAEANARGDSIVMVLNLDMIGYYENSTYATIYHGEDTTYAQRWKTLADSLSLVGISGFLSGTSSGSDHYPFQQSGYDVLFLIEYTFSTVYHSSADSTTYLDFDYMTRMVRASLATAYDVDATYTPAPGLTLAAVGDVPQVILPMASASFEVAITPGYNSSIVPGSAVLHYSVDGGVWDTSPLTDLGGGIYEAALPQVQCDERLAYYVTADEATSGTFYLPDPAAPWEAVTATTSSVVYETNFESSGGWTVSGNALDGGWTVGIPIGGGDRGDPPSDFDGSGSCYLTDNVDGNSDVDDGTVVLTSPTFYLLSGDAIVHYARWFSNSAGDSPYEDVFRVYVSNNNGSTWVVAETVGPVDQASGGWFEHSFVVSDFVAPYGQMKIRFEASDLGSGSVVEAAVDDIRITGFECAPNYFVVVTDSLPDWTAGVPYGWQLESSGGTGATTWSDKYADLLGTGLSLSAAGMISGTPASPGPILFTAVATDENSEIVEKEFGCTINPAVAIVADALTKATEGEPYTAQLTCTGGTGEIVWSDLNGDLSGTGLTLAAGGILSGTPVVSGQVDFTAQALDAVGGSATEPFALQISPAYICGDVNGDGSDPNVGDLTFLVDHLFNGGPPPPVGAAADVDGSLDLNVSDLTYLVAYLFTGGPDPACP